MPVLNICMVPVGCRGHHHICSCGGLGISAAAPVAGGIIGARTTWWESALRNGGAGVVWRFGEREGGDRRIHTVERRKELIAVIGGNNARGLDCHACPRGFAWLGPLPRYGLAQPNTTRALKGLCYLSQHAKASQQTS
jgi:hypothetical protein